MKKLVIIIVLLLIFAGGGGGAYYYFFMMNKEVPEEPVQEEKQEVAGDTGEKPVAEAPKPRIRVGENYYVMSSRLNVRAYPEATSGIRAVLYKTDMITAKEIKGEWVRIGGYEVHVSGKDMAQWVHLNYLSATKPVITDEERRNTTVALIKKSDDFVQYEEIFIQATQELLNSGKCKIDDFELLGGWVRSVTYADDPVYFIYCRGTDLQHKIYLNVENGDVF
ncbi:hypothetical protein CSW98_04235 [Vibrio sp. HA2012]|uniref:hypothetical protein n=1 Tax=Vibrio sp. HA2012 TaxID=1971595 RepID=UPI000C2CA9B8|nr:hypothetical protein [Vibrio sp. HA2012]PJC87119.1 hypothetical protein CSW98_04235 [Vibrio sp. HA2012]